MLWLTCMPSVETWRRRWVCSMIPPTKRNASSWNALISGYDMHGFGKEALKLFSRMQEEGAEPNHITFTSILSACSHAGLIDEGRKCFADMKRLSVTLEVKHHACVVDMLGRAGLLQEAFDLIKEMPSPPSDGDQTNGKKLGQDMNNKGLKKPAAFSMIEYGKDILGFHTADQENPYRHEVYKKMESLAIEMKMAGYVPDLSCALHDVEEEDKENNVLFLRFEATRIIQDMESNGHIPILAMTADVIQATYEECQRCGMDGYVSKPFEAEQLYQEVSRFLQPISSVNL
ncbi:hypothetical protein DKX38_022384 [Salix brachista]|uniref:Response regulatory domain-containing protein n=1 Tax=Salix brachista TaxID=2182728 RepID=A0A5N5K546_9ROSI|nr:hypothetical protein DKX38_022384 [Salix brachista]